MSAKAQKTEAFLRRAIEAMFKAVGLDAPSESFTQQDGWYTKHEWTDQQRADFRKWFVANARRDMGWTKTAADKEFSYFDLMWGWKSRSE